MHYAPIFKIRPTNTVGEWQGRVQEIQYNNEDDVVLRLHMSVDDAEVTTSLATSMTVCIHRVYERKTPSLKVGRGSLKLEWSLRGGPSLCA